MRIRNDHPGDRFVPLLHKIVEPGETVELPAGIPMPHGFTALPSSKKVVPASEPFGPATTDQEHD